MCDPAGTPPMLKDPSLPVRLPMFSAEMNTCAPTTPWLVAASRTVPSREPWACAAAGSAANRSMNAVSLRNRFELLAGKLIRKTLLMNG